MSNLVDKIFAEVCLDERITDGIFKIDEEHHMNALRDYFIKRGMANESAIDLTNRMVEGKYPERQAYNKDGILVTFPTPQHKHKAIARGTHFEKNPRPKPQKEEPENNEPKVAPAGSKPEPGEVPNEKDKIEKPSTESPEKNGDEETEKKPNIFQGGKSLEDEPTTAVTLPPQPIQPIQPVPDTPEKIAAEKEIAKQIMATDDTALTNVANPMNESLKLQLNELYKEADKRGFSEAITFLTQYITP